MNTLDNVAQVELQKGQTMRLEHGSASRIVCCEGSLWLTRDGDIRDVVLRQGQCLRFEGTRDVLVSAFEPARFSVRRNRASLSRRRSLAFWISWISRKSSAIFA